MKSSGKPPKKITWACPKCGAQPEKHGRGKCFNDDVTCQGFLCDMLDMDGSHDAKGHGESYDKPCKGARCYHCEWSGTFPVPPKVWPAWTKAALAAGWKPPKGWAP